MKKLLNLIILTLLLFCCKDDDKISADGKFNTHENNRVSSLKMSKDEYSNWINKNGISNGENLIKITNDLYSHFPDNFDFIIFILNQENSPGFPQMFKNVSNNISGIGMDIFDNSSTYGSSGKLKGIIQLTTKNELTKGPSLHEIMHNWGNNIFETEKTSPTIGSSVKHRIYGFRGLVFDVDAEFNNTDEWYESIPVDARPRKNQPFYHLFAETPSPDQSPYIAYVSEQNLIPDDDESPIEHPDIKEFFEQTSDGKFIPRQKCKDRKSVV